MEEVKAAESSEKCSNVLKRIYELHIGKDIKRFLEPGGYKEYKKLIDKVIDEYDKETKGEIMANEIKNKFLDEQKLEENLFLEAEKAGKEIEGKEEEIEKIHQMMQNIISQEEDVPIQPQNRVRPRKCNEKQEFLEEGELDNDPKPNDNTEQESKKSTSNTSYLRTGFTVISAGITCVGLATVGSPAAAAIGIAALTYKGYKLYSTYKSKTE